MAGPVLPNPSNPSGSSLASLMEPSINGTLGKQDLKILKGPRGCQHGDCGRNLETIWKGAHTEIVHVGICDKGLTQNTESRE